MLLLRENKKLGNLYPILKSNPLFKFIKKYDPRIQLLLRVDNKFPSVIYKVFKNENSWQDELQEYVEDLVNKFCFVSIDERELVVPQNWSILVSDLGSEIAFVRFIQQYFKGQDQQILNEMIAANKAYIDFSESSI